MVFNSDQTHTDKTFIKDSEGQKKQFKPEFHLVLAYIYPSALEIKDNTLLEDLLYIIIVFSLFN